MPTISQEELDKLRALQAQDNLFRREGSTPEGEGLAARSIADYLRGGVGGGYGVGPLSGGGLSYGDKNTSEVPDWKTMAALRNEAREQGASVSQLQAADAAIARDRDSRAQNLSIQPRQAEKKVINGVETWTKSDFKPGETARNYARYDTSQGFQAPGTFGLLQNIFAPKDKDALDSNWKNPATQSIVSVGYGEGEVDPSIARAAGYSKQVAKDAGNYGLTWGTGRDTLGTKGVAGDVLGWVGDKTGLTNYNTPEVQAERTAAESARLAYEKAGRLAALTKVAPAVEPTPSIYTPPASVAPTVKRDKQSEGSRAQAQANRDQLSQAKSNVAEAAKSNSSVYTGGGRHGGFADGGPVGPLSPIATSMVDDDEQRRIQQMQLMQPQKPQQGALGQVKGQLIGQAASAATKALFGGATGGLGGLIGGLFEDGGAVHTMPDGSQMPGESHAPQGAGGDPVGQIVMALKQGQISPDQAAQALQQAGVPLESIDPILKQAMAPELSSGGPLAQAPEAPMGPEDAIAERVAEKLGGNTGGPSLPAEGYADGGSVSAMTIPGGGPISAFKMKKTKGHNTEEMSMNFDTKAGVPPMSDMANKALSNWK